METHILVVAASIIPLLPLAMGVYIFTAQYRNRKKLDPTLTPSVFLTRQDVLATAAIILVITAAAAVAVFGSVVPDVVAGRPLS